MPSHKSECQRWSPMDGPDSEPMDAAESVAPKNGALARRNSREGSYRDRRSLRDPQPRMPVMMKMNSEAVVRSNATCLFVFPRVGKSVILSDNHKAVVSLRNAEAVFASHLIWLSHLTPLNSDAKTRGSMGMHTRQLFGFRTRRLFTTWLHTRFLRP